jgi:membrane-associated protein
MLDIETREIIETAGYLGVFAIVLAQSGILLGFFLPGNTFLITTGILASLGYFNIHLLVFICFLASFTGNIVGYYIGHKWGRRLFNREKSFLFNKIYLSRAEKFYGVHGGKTLILARFINVIRTFAPIISGIGHMHYRAFMFYNLLGALLWTAFLLYGGYFLGQTLANANKFIFLAIYIIVVIIIYPQIYKNFKTKKGKKVDE